MQHDGALVVGRRRERVGGVGEALRDQAAARVGRLQLGHDAREVAPPGVRAVERAVDLGGEVGRRAFREPQVAPVGRHDGVPEPLVHGLVDGHLLDGVAAGHVGGVEARAQKRRRGDLHAGKAEGHLDGRERAVRVGPEQAVERSERARAPSEATREGDRARQEGVPDRRAAPRAVLDDLERPGGEAERVRRRVRPDARAHHVPSALGGVRGDGPAEHGAPAGGHADRQVQRRRVARGVDARQPARGAVRPGVGVDHAVALEVVGVEPLARRAGVDHLDARAAVGAGRRERDGERVAVARVRDGLRVHADEVHVHRAVEAQHERVERVRVRHVEGGAPRDAERLGVQVQVDRVGADVDARLHARRLDGVGVGARGEAEAEGEPQGAKGEENARAAPRSPSPRGRRPSPTHP